MAKQKPAKFRIGEIIRIISPFGLPPAGVYRVDGAAGDLLMLSAGDIRAGIHPRMVTVLERGLPEPANWLAVEVDLLTQQATTCDCIECKKLLLSKTAQLHAQASRMSAAAVH